MGIERSQVSHGARLNAGLGGYKVGLPEWPTQLRGDQIWEFRPLIHELWAGTVKGKDSYGQGQLGAEH